jgi:hypothetical protein
MEKGEIQNFVAYLKDLEEGVVEWDYNETGLQLHLSLVSHVIKQLTNATFETKDQDLKPLLATLSKKAHRCKRARSSGRQEPRAGRDCISLQ